MAYHQELPHGAGLVMISRAYFSHMIEVHACDERFVRMARAMGMADAAKPGDFIKALGKLQDTCGVADLKMPAKQWGGYSSSTVFRSPKRIAYRFTKNLINRNE